jgi:hypothetical protein
MTNILDNELVRKYFAFDLEGKEYDQSSIAACVLHAMQEPIRKGERYLGWPSYTTVNQWTEQVCGEHEITPIDFHPFQLRLPDRFQKRECKAGFLKCQDCGEEIIHKPQLTDAVEENQTMRTAFTAIVVLALCLSGCASVSAPFRHSDSGRMGVRCWEPPTAGFDGNLQFVKK